MRSRCDVRPSCHHIAGLNQRLFVFTHELCPALSPDHDLEIRHMFVPAGSRFWRHVRLDKVRDDLAIGRFGNP